MNFKRKIERIFNEEPHCCGQRMARKDSYDTKTEKFYFCERCGKEKLVDRRTENGRA